MKLESDKSDYQFITGDNSIKPRSTRLKYLDYFRILCWRERDFIKKEFKLKLNKLKDYDRETIESIKRR